PDAVAFARLSERTLDVVEGRLELKHLPEEAAHFYVSILEQVNNKLYKAMYNQVTKYELYDRIAADPTYQKLYEGDETLIREEAMGHIIAEYIVNTYKGAKNFEPTLSKRQVEQVKNWWTALWNSIRKLFGKVRTDNYANAAYDIMNKRLHRLELEQTELKDANMYALDSSTWNDLFADKTIGGYKYRYFQSESQAEEYFKQAQDQFGNDNVSIAISGGKFKGKVIVKNPNLDSRVEANKKKAIAEKNYS
ncbi:unnamed protein product, partial [marine sediment metagenome]